MTNEDRSELLLAASYGCGCFPDKPDLCESCRCSFDPTIDAVELIVARHVTAALNEAADAIHIQRFARDDRIKGGPDNFYNGAITAERIVRSRIPNP